MKKIILFFSLAILANAAIPVNAQTDSAVNLPNFLLPRFTKSIIKFKTGSARTAMLNYNVVDQEMVFMQPDAYMVLENPELIDTVNIDNRKFIPFKKEFYELVLNGPIELFIQHKVNLEIPGTATGYGATSKTLAPSEFRQVYGPRGSINLRVPDEYKLTDDSHYWIRRDMVMEKFSNKRQFLKLFKNKEKQLNQFIDQSNIDFKKTDDVIKLVQYSSGL
jgi:hypothetical protein